ncbi:LuxR C-terminal-related transcriptional regulator [Actinomadura fulvescens]|uniref:LuxR family transcriptional regulator n=1 Tax=Actinomadura fulvescens TaxID=46160 RepID=A0ABN3Q8G6_9ACTN
MVALVDALGATTSYIGRRREAAEVRSALGESRLVTLVGPGGVGKTRLVKSVAAQVAGEFGDGVVFIGLAELREGDRLPYLVATRLGLHARSGQPAAEMVLDHLRDRELLVILDNCEHLVDAAAAFAAEVLAECPGVVTLATSRQSLALAGERVFRVPPLPVPSGPADSADATAEPARFDGVRLFVERAAEAVPGFELTEDNGPAVIQICRSLDGLPLAIELAAARVRSLSPAQIVERLPRSLRLLTTSPRRAPERQRTLRATIEWSFELCSPAEKAVWLHSSVFAGSFDLEAAEHVCAGTEVPRDAVLDTVEGLLDKSVLMRIDHGRVVRYRMLETLREHGQELLEQAGELARTARLHRDWVDTLTAAADAAWAGPEQLDWIARLRHEHANLRAAMEWCLAEPGEAGAVLRIASRLDEYWTYFGHSVECRQWLDRALAVTAADHPDRVKALTACALQAVWHLDLERAGARLDEAERLARGPRPGAEHEPRPGAEVASAFITYVRSLAAQIRTDPGAAELAASAAATFRAHGDVRRELHPLWIYGVSVGYRRGDVEEGRRALRRMLQLTEACGETRYRAMAQFGLAYLEVERGDVEVAAGLAHRSLDNLRKIGSGSGTAYLLDAHAWIADRQGEHERAAVLFGAAATVWRAIGSSPEIAVSGPHLSHKAAARAALGADAFDRAFAAGRVMPGEEAVRYALGETGPGPAERPAILTRREHEIAELVAAGLSNREIATKLVISQRTAATHVQNILAKLGFHNRAQIAAWFAASSG